MTRNIARCLALALLAGCGDAGGPPADPIVPQLSIVAGDVQTDTVMRTLPVQIGAVLTDKATGDPLPGRVVNWVVLEGGGQVFAAVTQTGGDGVARQSWTLGQLAGGQRLVARWLDPETGEPVTLDTARAIAMPDTAVTFSVVWNPDWVLHPALDTIAIPYVYGDRWGNITHSCGGGRDPDALTWRLRGGYPYGADSLARPLGTANGALLVEVGGYAPSAGVGTTVALQALSCIVGARDTATATLRFDWQ